MKAILIVEILDLVQQFCIFIFSTRLTFLRLLDWWPATPFIGIYMIRKLINLSNGSSSNTSITEILI